MAKAKVIYSARIIKESAQELQGTEDSITHPFDETRGDLIEFYGKLTDQNAYHARCLRVKTDCTVNLGINILEGNETTLKERFTNINDYGQSFNEVISRVSLDFETTGNGYLEVVRGIGNRVEELYHCPAQLVTLRPRYADSRFYYNNGEDDIKFPLFKKDESDKNSLIHFSNHTQGNRHYGLPDWRGTVNDIELDYYAVKFNQSFFLNSGIPDIAIIVEGGEFSEEVEKEVVDFFSANFKGIENAHRTLYLPINGVDVKVRFEKLAMEVQQDGSFDTLRSRCRDNIISAHGVPPRLVGVVTSGQLGGGGETQGQLKIFKEITIEPRQTMFEAKLAPVIDGMESGAKIEFQSFDVSVLENVSMFYPSMVNSRILTINEARKDMGYKPVEEIEDDETAKFITGVDKKIDDKDDDKDDDKEKPMLELVKTLESINKTL